MLTILVLLVGLTLATAVIAYWSDNLGKKLGKKRVSLWGMRPRTTATFLTIASSWVIMIFTLGVMLALFKPLRQALLKYDEVKASVNDLKESKTELTGQVGDLDGQVKSLTASFDQASDKLKRVSGELIKSTAAAKNASREQKTAESDARAAKTSASKALASERAAVAREQKAGENLKIVTKQRDATQQQRDNAQQEFKAAQSELKRASLEVKAATARVKAAGERVKTAQSKVKTAENQVKQEQANLKKVRTDLYTAQTKADAASRRADASQRLADAADARATDAAARATDIGKQAISASKQALAAQKDAIESKKEVIESKKAVDQLQAQRAELIRANAELSDDKKLSDLKRQLVQGSDIRVPVGFALDARTFEPGLSLNEASQRLHGIFDYVATKVMPGDEQNLPILPGAQLRLAQDVPFLTKGQDGEKIFYVRVDADEIYDSLATTISRSQTPLSVRLIADRNHLEGEPFLDARFIIVPQRLALSAETELARATFSGKISDARLFSALLNLTDAAREVARKNGVDPPLSPDARDFFASGSNEQIFEALRKISALDGRARVRLLTDKAISTTDQLSVRFEVEPLPSETAATSASKAPA